MKRMKLKNKMILGSLATVILVMLVSIIAVSIVINMQNRKASGRNIKKSLNIIREDLMVKQTKLLNETGQLATINDMGSKVKFLFKYKRGAMQSMTDNTYDEITNDILHIGRASQLSAVAIYDIEGDLIGFALRKGHSFLFGHILDSNKGTYKYDTLKDGEQEKSHNWKELDTLQSGDISFKFRNAIPNKETVEFTQIHNSLGLISYVPILGNEINRETSNIEKKQFGFAMAILTLDMNFVERMSRLTEMDINIFTNDGLSIGTLNDYKEPEINKIDKITGTWHLAGQEILFNDIELEQGNYFQGILPVYSGSKMVGLLSALLSKDIVISNTWQIIKLLIIVFLSCTLCIVPLTALFSNAMTKSIIMVVAGLRDFAQGGGDLTSRLEVKSADEVGELAKWFNAFVEKLQGMIKDIAGKAGILEKSCSELSNLSSQMSSGAIQISDNSNTMATSAEEMSTSISSVASAMEQTSTNMGMVATSVEEMNATINEIAQNSERASTITGEAVTQAQNSSVRVGELGEAAQDITKVTEAITEISEQTNLLALNATIEAARAGEAGKGFAVVANEIKALARQTAQATEDIKTRIESIQGSSKVAVSEIGDILKVISDVNETVSMIATSVEEQSITTKEIAHNVTHASSGVQEVNENLANSSTVAQEIAKDVYDVNQATNDMSNSSAQVNLRAEGLAKLADELKGMVGKFNV